MCEASLYPAAPAEALSYGCSAVLPCPLGWGRTGAPAWADITPPPPPPYPRTMKRQGVKGGDGWEGEREK